MSSIDWYKILGYIIYPLVCTGGGKGYVAPCICRYDTIGTGVHGNTWQYMAMFASTYEYMN
jgi:hypothetical protein